jgi:hypothetical protein
MLYSYLKINPANTVLSTNKLGMKYWRGEEKPVVIEDFDSLDEINEYVNKHLVN